MHGRAEWRSPAPLRCVCRPVLLRRPPAAGLGAAPLPHAPVVDPDRHLLPDQVYESLHACSPGDGRADLPEGTPQWVFHEDVATQTKSCTLTTTPDLPPGVPWGPVSSYNWNGDFGYWFDEVGVRDLAPPLDHVSRGRHGPGVRAYTPCPIVHPSATCGGCSFLQACLPRTIAMSREVLRGIRTFCTVQVDFVDLPPPHRIMPVWEAVPNVSAGRQYKAFATQEWAASAPPPRCPIPTRAYCTYACRLATHLSPLPSGTPSRGSSSTGSAPRGSRPSGPCANVRHPTPLRSTPTAPP